MDTFKIKLSIGAGVTLDAAKLVEGRALIQGASGSGKSYLVRVIVEQTIAKGLQTIILDPEGEFVTLREKCKVLIAGRGGDVPAEIKSAKLLARRIAETGVNAVVDLSDLRLEERRHFVRIFLETLDMLPKRLEAARLVVLDEAHRFCPESGKGSATSTDAVIALMSQGRKRGLAGILVTQRLSKLRKDAAAEVNNIFIGRTSPIDLASAQDVLGITKPERESLRRMKRGRFIVTGPALSDPEPREVMIRESITTHPKPGTRHLAKTPPPQRAITRILKEFEALPPSQEQEDAENLQAANTRIRELEREFQRVQATADTGSTEALGDVMAEFTELKRLTRDREGTLRMEIKRLREAVEDHANGLLQVGCDLANAEDTAPTVVEVKPKPPMRPPPKRAPPRPTAPDEAAPPNGEALGRGGKFRMMAALAQHGAEGCDRRQLALLAGMSVKSGTFAKYLGQLRASGYLENFLTRIRATAAGVSALGSDYERMPTPGPELAAYWLGRMGGGGKRRLLEALIAAGTVGLTRQALAEAADLSVVSGTFAKYLGQIRTLKLADGGAHIRVAETLI